MSSHYDLQDYNFSILIYSKQPDDKNLKPERPRKEIGKQGIFKAHSKVQDKPE